MPRQLGGAGAWCDQIPLEERAGSHPEVTGLWSSWCCLERDGGGGKGGNGGLEMVLTRGGRDKEDTQVCEPWRKAMPVRWELPEETRTGVGRSWVPSSPL